MLQLCECQDIEHLGSVGSTQESRVFVLYKLFPRVQYPDIRKLTHELIVNLFLQHPHMCYIVCDTLDPPLPPSRSYPWDVMIIAVRGV